MITQDELFDQIAQTCQDCGASFSSSRHGPHCATCLSLRNGLVGPATVVCPVCRAEHTIPVLAPSRLCDLCRVDLARCRVNIAADLEAAEKNCIDVLVAMKQAADQATDQERDRYNAALELRETCALNGRRYTPAQVERSWSRAMAAGDGLATLLMAHEARAAAEQQLGAARTWARSALEEVERAEGR